MVVVEINIIPLGVGTSVSSYLVSPLKKIIESGVKYEITPMSTVFEVESVEEALKIAREAHEATFSAGVKRVVTTIRIDDRRDREGRMEEKVAKLKGLLR